MSTITPIGLEDERRPLLRRTVVGAVVVVVLSTAAAVTGLILFAQYTSLVLRAYFATLGLLIGLQAVANFARYAFGDEAAASARGVREPRGRALNWPSDLFSLEARISLAKVSAFDYGTRLRPVLRELAAQRLAARWNIDLDAERARGRAHVGDALWAELEDDRAGGRDERFLPGPSAARIHQLIDDLEAI